MATITARRVVEDLLRNGGRYRGDPVAAQVIEFVRVRDGRLMWHVSHAAGQVPAAADGVGQVLTLFRDGEITDHGKRFLGRPGFATVRQVVGSKTWSRLVPSVRQTIEAWEGEVGRLRAFENTVHAIAELPCSCGGAGSCASCLAATCVRERA